MPARCRTSTQGELGGEGVGDPAGAVGGVVVDHEDAVAVQVELLPERPHHRLDVLPFVVGRQADASHAWRDLTGRDSGPPVAARAYDRTVARRSPATAIWPTCSSSSRTSRRSSASSPSASAAYRRAAARIRDTASSVAELALEGKAKELPDIGKTIEAKIVEVVETGDMEALAKRRAEVPGEVAAFMRLPGLGPKTAARIWRELGVTTLAGLKAAAEGEQLRTLAGMGPTTEAKMLKALAEGHGPEQPRRGLLGKGLPVVREVVETLAAHPAALDVSEAGSTRRRRETFRDLDVIATATDPAALTAYFVGLPWVLEVVAHGDTKATVITKQGLRLDLRVVPPESYGDLLQHFTGSKDHNVALREQAQRAGFSVSEYGVTEVESGKVHTFRDEAALYAFLGYSFIPPELRENGGELEAARAGLLPELVELADLRGEMHCHSTWSSDGKATIEEMALAAAARGYEFLCLTDHSHYLREGRIEQQWRRDRRRQRAHRPVPRAPRRRGEHHRPRRRRRPGRDPRRARLGGRVAAHLARPEPDGARARGDRQPARRLHRPSHGQAPLEATRGRARPRSDRGAGGRDRDGARDQQPARPAGHARRARTARGRGGRADPDQHRRTLDRLARRTPSSGSVRRGGRG